MEPWHQIYRLEWTEKGVRWFFCVAWRAARRRLLPRPRHYLERESEFAGRRGWRQLEPTSSLEIRWEGELNFGLRVGRWILGQKVQSSASGKSLGWTVDLWN